ncbi:plastidic glucose transporter 4-like protein [Tanacetum coccineum]|uniref:Plastidic glucose transporter 4-like protein n=1 Tax=Tanacetum coccineum TaxID=301880 RepID=A0ABQ5I5U2_9ASTR
MDPVTNLVDINTFNDILLDEDIEEITPLNSPSRSSGSVLPYVSVASLGAILFGYHLGVVNGALEYLVKDLGIVENTVLQGWVVSTLLAGATVGSFTGGLWQGSILEEQNFY